MKYYRPGAAFSGRLERTAAESEPAWPQSARAKRGAPNVLFIVLDDTGFGHLGCYGSPIRTPHIDRLATNGLRYTNMHTTALCSPTRSCFLTGRNHHSNAMACITEGATGYPGANGQIPFENGFLSEVLLENGYSTYCVGKWHLAPAEQTSAAGPHDRWPLGRGFERYYGFLGGDTSQYHPDLVYDNHQIEPPKSPEEGYHLTEDLTNKAIEFIADAKQLAPTKPFFLYFATGAMHAPHHVPKLWADKYKGRFDGGWDAYRELVFERQKALGLLRKDAKLSPRDPDVQEWASLPEGERKLYARMMEVFAGFLEHTDHHIGRLLDFLASIGELDNTLVMVVSDNGASAEGGPHGSVNELRFFNNVKDDLQSNLAAINDLGGPRCFNHYPWGWTFAGNTPFRRWKRETYRGGVSDPLIVHFPRGIRARGEVRTQFVHAIDLMPTVLDVVGIQPPAQIRGYAQSPIQGTSFRTTFDDPHAESPRSTQYFEMFGHRSIYHDGWRAVCPWPGPSFAEASAGFGELELTEEKLRELDAKGWELYDVEGDPTETTNLAAIRRDKLIEMIARWYAEAGKYNVLPLDSRGTTRLAEPRPTLGEQRERFVYYPGTQSVPDNVAARTLNRAHSIVAEVYVPKHGAEGVLLCHGGMPGGYTFFVQDSKLHYVHNYVGLQEFHFESTETIVPGNVALRFSFQPTGLPDLANGNGAPGRVTLHIDDKLVGQGMMSRTIPLVVSLGQGLAVGRNPGSAVTSRYRAPFAFTGRIYRVTVDLSGDMIQDLQEEERAFARAALARQ